MPARLRVASATSIETGEGVLISAPFCSLLKLPPLAIRRTGPVGVVAMARVKAPLASVTAVPRVMPLEPSLVLTATACTVASATAPCTTLRERVTLGVGVGLGVGIALHFADWIW